ncbi:MTH1187 family thiamine-binding protein [Arcobacter porcinus]|uniref:Thiamine binding protein n=1 Tax=Arcobacter porcinus TaxID=1935204 RepID=A0A1C0AYU2_9BACT|nr:MTH1187 family thiamine-binding protein [Arcobacter porcinus]OCL96571.1 hypothetical protein AAX27_00621 [Aliarcobacter thereius]OCL83612.1 hypothetical protein AAW30_00850 [Arcobacter porcinus]OCL83831.1 hypothetical protein AAW29_00662 [Arcobacter porcinus]OCL92824.1 hypothetical protein AAX28_00364 [Arcobacter porcinus]QEP41179.1 thiamine binding protein [Arcobacter porcinus]
MSVIMSLAMFPTNKIGSKSKDVSEVLKVIKNSGLNYELTSMNTIVEAKTLKELLDLIDLCYLKLDEMGCDRVYISVNFDARKEGVNRMKSKIESVQSLI